MWREPAAQRPRRLCAPFSRRRPGSGPTPARQRNHRDRDLEELGCSCRLLDRPAVAFVLGLSALEPPPGPEAVPGDGCGEDGDADPDQPDAHVDRFRHPHGAAAGGEPRGLAPQGLGADAVPGLVSRRWPPPAWQGMCARRVIQGCYGVSCWPSPEPSASAGAPSSAGSVPAASPSAGAPTPWSVP